MEPPPGRSPSTSTGRVLGRRQVLGLAGVAAAGAVGARVLRPAWDRSGLVVSTPVADAAPTVAAVDRPAPRGVAVLGDSITYQADAAIRAALAGVTPLSVVGRSGFTVEQLLPDAEAAALADPAAVVIELGTNDALQAVPRATTTVALDSMLSLFPDAAVVVVTVSTAFGDAACQARARAINAHLRSFGTAVADWDAAVDREMAAGWPDGPITVDFVHPSPRGQQVLAGLIAGALPTSVFAA
jgi:lysophospholipase L1-like esterase